MNTSSSEAMWDNKYLFCQTAEFGVICYIAIDKYYNYRLPLFISESLAIFQG